jgi:hypothetical protein
METKKVQIEIDIITKESRQFAQTVIQTKEYNKAIAESKAKIVEYQKQLRAAEGNELKRLEILKKITVEEANIAKNTRLVADEAKKVASIDLSKLTPAQLVERSRQLATIIRDIPQSTPEYAQLNAELRRTNQQLADIKTKSKGISEPAGGAGLLTKGAGIFAGITAFVGSLSGITSATRETEKLFAVLRNSVGNTGAALKIFNEIQQFAATTPFALNEVVGAFTKLQQRNFNPTIDQLRAIGDIAASQGKSIDQFVEAVLDAQTGEFERLKEFGIVARKEGDQVTATFRGQSETFKLTSDNIKTYLLGLGQLPGILGATDSVAATLDGSISNLDDNWGQLLATLGSGGGILKGVVDFFSQLVGSINNFLRQPLSERLREQQSEFNALVGILQDVNASEDTRNRAIARLQQEYPDYIGNIDLQTASEGELNQVLSAGNALFLKRIFLQQNEEEVTRRTKGILDIQKRLFDLQVRNRQLGAGGGGIFASEEINRNAQEIKRLTSELQVAQFTFDEFQQQQNQFAASLGLSNASGIDAFGFAGAETATPDGPEKGTGSPAEKAKLDAEAAAGSLEFLRQQVSDLQRELERTPGDSKALAPLIDELKRAETALQQLQDKINQLKNPAQEIAPGLQEIFALFGQGSPGERDFLDTEDQRAALVASTNDFIVQDEQATQFEIDEIRQEATRRELERQEKEREARRAAREIDAQEARDLEIQGAEAVAGVLGEIERNRLEQETDEALSALDQEYAAKIRAAEGNVVEQERLQRELERKRQAIELDAARKRKALAIKEAIIQGALAVIKALPNAAAAISAGIAAAAQVAVIASQKLEKGGLPKMGFFGGRRHSAGGTKGYFDDGTTIEVEKDEAFAVVNRKNAPMLRFLSAVNSYGGNGVPFFKKGGVMRFDTGGLPAINTTPVSSYTSAPAGQGITELNGFMSAVAMFGRIVDQFPRVLQAQVSYLALEEKAAELEKVRSDAAF